MNTQVAERRPNPLDEVRHQLSKMEEQFRFALPAHIPVERFARVVMTAIQNNPKLVTHCTRQSLWNACMKAAQDGLLPDGREGAIVQNGDQAGWRPMIAGIRKKVRNSGEIATWDVHVVKEKDKFAFRLGDNPFIEHEPSLDDDPGPTVAAYSIATLKSGEKSRDVMSISAIRRIRDRSDAWKAYKANKIKSTPWQTDEDEMAKKTVARRHSKVLPMSTDLDDLMRRDDDLYDTEGAGDKAQVERPRSLAGKLDALAGMHVDTSNADDDNEIVDEETGEITTIGADQADATDASEDAPIADEPAEQKTTAKPKSIKKSEKSNPVAVAEAAAGTEGAGAAPATASAPSQDEPKTEAEYIAYSDAWIATVENADVAERTWANEKALRNRCNVSPDVREVQQEKLKDKIAGLRK